VTGGIRRHVQSVLADMKRNDFDSDSAATDPASDEASQRIVRVLSKAMTPVVLEVDGVESEGDASDEEEEDEGVDAAYRTYRCVIQRCLVAAPPALEALALLTRAFSESPSVVGEELLLTLAAFTNKSVVRPWVPSAETAERASTQLRELLAASDTTQPRFIVEVVLQRYLRRLFSKSKPAAITSAGRKAEYVDPVAGRGEGLPDDTSETKPWKFTDFRAITLAGWVVGEADVRCCVLSLPSWLLLVLCSTTDPMLSVGGTHQQALAAVHPRAVDTGRRSGHQRSAAGLGGSEEIPRKISQQNPPRHGSVEGLRGRDISHPELPPQSDTGGRVPEASCSSLRSSPLSGR